MTNQVMTTGSGQIQTKEEREKTVYDVLQNDNVRNALEEILPNNLDANRFARIALTSLRNSPKLLQCEPASFLSALLQSATLGLEPNTPLGHSYLIPYGKEATLVVGYEGYIDLAYRSGVVTSIHANVVRNGEDFEWSEGSNPYINHKPSATPQTYTQGKQIYQTGRDVSHAYAIARLVGGGHVQVVMSKAEVDAIKSRSRASHDGPWVTDPVAMMKKTAIRQLRKFLPMSPQARALHMAAGIDEQADAGLEQTFVDVPADLFDLKTVLKEPEQPPQSSNKGQQDDSDVEAEVIYCPVHETALIEGKYGLQHRIEGTSEFCSPPKLINALIAEWDMERDEVNAALKDKYGITISKAGIEHYSFVEDMVKNEESKAREAVDQVYRNRMKEGQDETQETEDDWDSLTLTTPDGSVQIPDSEDEGQVGLWPN
jgi:recombination protein RecT